MKKKKADDKERQAFMEWKAKRKQAQIQPEPQELPLEWSDVPGQAISNLPS